MNFKNTLCTMPTWSGISCKVCLHFNVFSGDLYVDALIIELFKEDLDKNLKSNNTVKFSDNQNTFTTVLHKHAPIKKKILRFNNSPFMSKSLRKIIMHRSKLENVYNKKKDRCKLGKLSKTTEFLCHATSVN